MPSETTSTTQFDTFKDALARRIISSPGLADDTSDPAELDDFTSYLAAPSRISPL